MLLPCLPLYKGSLVLFSYWLLKSAFYVADKGTTGLVSNAAGSTKVIYPDTTQMVIYDPRQKPGVQSFSFKLFSQFLKCQFTFIHCRANVHDAILNSFLVNPINNIVILVSSEHGIFCCYCIMLLIVNCLSYFFELKQYLVYLLLQTPYQILLLQWLVKQQMHLMKYWKQHRLLC